MNLSTWLMNFLLMVAAYGLPLTPQDDAWEFDFNGNGFIDYSDIIEMLALQPNVEEFGLYEEKLYKYYVKSFYYRYGPVETTKPWYSPIPKKSFDNWVRDFNQLDLEDYSIYLGGKYVIDPQNTNDVDICITGPIYDYNKLFHIMKTGYELALNKYNFLVDIKHYDNLDFFKYPRTEGFKRYHIMTELAGIEQKIINGIEVINNIKKTYIPDSDFIPKEFAVNIAIFPMEKQIKDGRIYDPIKLN